MLSETVNKITIEIAKNKKETLRKKALIFKCSWGIELGMGVLLVNEGVTTVGVQNDAL